LDILDNLAVLLDEAGDVRIGKDVEHRF